MGLVSRDIQLQALRDLLAKCIAGSGQTAVIVGPMGTGKTALLKEFTQLAAEAGALVLSATASRTERALPFGVLSQLLHSPLIAMEAAPVGRLLDDAGVGVSAGDATEPRMPPPLLNAVRRMLVELSARRPVVLAVDEVQHTDLASMECLLYLVRRTVSARVMVVLCDAGSLHRKHPVHYSELVRWPTCWLVQVGLLTPREVVGVLADRLGRSSEQGLSAACHDATGGSPLLVNALIDDSRAEPDRHVTKLVFGAAFRAAVLTCLHRAEPEIPAVAKALAVLDESPDREIVGELADLVPGTAARVVIALSEAALLENGRFRHPAARAAVLDGMPAGERAALHRRAAEILYHRGRPVTTVARHVIAADHVDAGWVVPVLREAAELALAAADASEAIRYLLLAHRTSADQRERSAIKTALARAEWRVNPSTAARHLTELAADVRDGHLSGRMAVTPLNHLLWHGRVDEAFEVMARFANRTAAPDAEPGPDRGSILAWLRYAYPDLSRRVERVWPAQGSQPPGPETAPLSVDVVAHGEIGALLVQGFGASDEQALATVERVLRNASLDETSFVIIAAALTTMICAAEPDRAASLCYQILGKATVRRIPTSRALLSATMAVICLRQGDLPGAAENASAALAIISPPSWGVVIGLPLAAAVSAAVALGDLKAASTYLDIPVPKAMFHTPVGLHYLEARGQYSLAAGRSYAALADFDGCGRLLARWELDVPALIPWRSDAAQAYLSVGRLDEAERLATEQLAMLDAHFGRARGTALRVLAAAADPARRPELLREAVDALRESGDHLSEALAWAELGLALRASGQTDDAEMSSRRALLLARRCGVETVDHLLLDQPAGRRGSPGQDTDLSELSDAERRVAALAAHGRTNRQIARELHITISTVEQHLTRVYRKLNVRHRRDLPLAALGG
jgi:DNA-binding CsgD family transcriptional regulator